MDPALVDTPRTLRARPVMPAAGGRPGVAAAGGREQPIRRGRGNAAGQPAASPRAGAGGGGAASAPRVPARAAGRVGGRAPAIEEGEEEGVPASGGEDNTIWGVPTGRVDGGNALLSEDDDGPARQRVVILWWDVFVLYHDALRAVTVGAITPANRAIHWCINMLICENQQSIHS